MAISDDGFNYLSGELAKLRADQDGMRRYVDSGVRRAIRDEMLRAGREIEGRLKSGSLTGARWETRHHTPQPGPPAMPLSERLTDFEFTSEGRGVAVFEPGISPATANFAVYNLLNGDFSEPPPLGVGSQIGNANPLPYWPGPTQNGTAFSAYYVADAASPTGLGVEFRMVAGAGADSMTFQTLPIYIGGSRARWTGHVGRVALYLAAASSGVPRGEIACEYLDADGNVLAGGNSFALELTLVTAVGLAVKSYTTQSPPALARYMRLYVTIYRWAMPVGATATVRMSDVRLDRAVPFVGIAEGTSPASFGPTTIEQNNGVLSFLLGSGGGSVINLNSAALTNVGDLDLTAGLQLEGWLEDSPVIAANKNNYDIWTDAATTPGAVFGFQCDVSGADRTITGLLAAEPGRVVYIGVHHLQTFGLNFAHLSGSSTAANRIVTTTGATVSVGPGEGAWFYYSVWDNRWKMFGLNKNFSGATQVSFPNAVASDYLARIKEGADTQYRAILGLDASDNPALLLGPGGATAPDISLYRAAARTLYLLFGGAAAASSLRIGNGGIAQDTWIDVETTASLVGGFRAGVSVGNVAQIRMGSPSPGAFDTRIQRSAAKTLTIDDDAGGDAVLNIVGQVDVSERASAPSTPASGRMSIYAKTDGNLYRLNDAGVEVALDAAGGGGGGGPTLTVVEEDLGTLPRYGGTFDITSSGLTPGDPVLVGQATGPYTGKGDREDESEMDLVIATGYVVDATTIRVYWTCAPKSGPIAGNVKFQYGAAGAGALTDHTHEATGSGADGGGDTLNPVTLAVSGGTTIGGQIIYSNIIRPTISAATNNWSPTGIETCSLLVVDVTGGSQNLTGFDAADWTEGETKDFVLTNTNTLVLVHNSAASTSGNRIAGVNGANQTIRTNGGFRVTFLPTDFAVAPFHIIAVNA